MVLSLQALTHEIPKLDDSSFQNPADRMTAILDPQNELIQRRKASYESIREYLDTGVELEGIIRVKNSMQGLGSVEFNNSLYEFTAGNTCPHLRKLQKFSRGPDLFDKMTVGDRVRFIVKKNPRNPDTYGFDVVITQA